MINGLSDKDREKYFLSLLTKDENEVLEFKTAKDTFTYDSLGEYFSALSNEAYIRELDQAWLVFGVSDKKEILGTNYLDKPGELDQLKHDITKNLTPKMSFREIHTIYVNKKIRLIFFEIPPAPGEPVAWKGEEWGRDGSSKSRLSLEERNRILNKDWSKELVPSAPFDSLHSEALVYARKKFMEKNLASRENIQQSSDKHFLRMLGLMQGDHLTRAALLLLGQEESASLLPYKPIITLELKNKATPEHFGLPFLIKTEDVYHKLGQDRIKILIEDSLTPEKEIPKYDQLTVLEALHNCIAHQDYTLREGINIIEHDGYLEFISSGSFFEYSPEAYIPPKIHDSFDPPIPSRYRNRLLALAMYKLGMIDKLGFGIQKMYQNQKERLLPLPDYVMTSSSTNNPQVRLTISCKYTYDEYVKLLCKYPSLPLWDILSLDYIHKGKKPSIPEDISRKLEEKGYIKGKYPDIHLSAE